MPPPSYFPLRWESTGDKWWYAAPIDWAAANGHYDLVHELLHLDGNHFIKLTSLRRIQRLEVVWDDEQQFDNVARNRSWVARKLLHGGLIGSGHGGWVLYTAASAGDLDFVQELLQKDPLLVFGEGEYGVTDILYAAARSKKAEVFGVIYDFAVSPRLNGREFEEPIGGMPKGYKEEMKNRAVHVLARGGNLKLLTEFLGGCSNEDVAAFRDVRGSTILHTAAARGQVEVVEYLISSYEIVDSVDQNGNTALHVAAYRGQLSAVQVLIRARPSSIHSRNHAGETFLHTAVAGFQAPTFRRLDRQTVLMKQLVGSKTFHIEDTINATDNEGRTALHLAASGNIHSDLMELLMTVGSIDVNLRDNHGMAPLDLLNRRPESDSSALVSAGASRDYSARKIIASRLGDGSPGTSFRVSDSEMFSHTGMDTSFSTVYGTPGSSGNSTELSRLNSSPNSNSEAKSPKKSKHKGIQRFLGWIRRRKPVTPTRYSDEIPIPLRLRYSRPNNKRTLAARSNLSSPSVEKKRACGLVDGVVPRLNRSDSFSKASASSHGSSGGKLAGPSGSNQTSDDGLSEALGVVSSRRLANQCFCFGAAGG